jgi:hypothetical protein
MSLKHNKAKKKKESDDKQLFGCSTHSHVDF